MTICILTDARVLQSHPFLASLHLATLDVDEVRSIVLGRKTILCGANDVPFFLQNGLNKEYIIRRIIYNQRWSGRGLQVRSMNVSLNLNFV